MRARYPRSAPGRPARPLAGALAAAVLALAAPPAAAGGSGPPSPFDPPFPRLLLYAQARDNPTSAANPPGGIHQYGDFHAADLARWNLVAIDANFPYWYPGILGEIEARNAAALLVLAWESAYSYDNWDTAIEIDNDIPFHRAIVKDARFTPAWLVQTDQGVPFLQRHTNSFPEPGADIFYTNPTDFCPLGPTGLRFRDFVVTRTIEELAAHPEYDGVLWDAIGQSAWAPADLNLDGEADSSAERRAWWTGTPDPPIPFSAGYSQAIAAVNAAFPEKVALLQSGASSFASIPPAYAAEIQGDIFPEFPMPFWFGGDAGDFVGFWRDSLRFTLDWMEHGRAPSMGWISGGRHWLVVPPSESDHYRYDRMRYTLGSALLVGAYCAYDGGDSGHWLRWWYDEYDACGAGKGWLGQPLGPAIAVSSPEVTIEEAVADWSNRQIASTLWRRDFTNGIVLVNAGYPGERTTVEDAGGFDAWFDLPHANLVPGSVLVDDHGSFSSPWQEGVDYEVDHAPGRLRFLSSGNIAEVDEMQSIAYEVVGGTAIVASLGGPFRKLFGAQDRATNDGSTVSSVAVPGRDAIVLMRPAYAANAVSILLDDQNPEFLLSGPGWTTRGWTSVAHEITGGGANRYGPTFRFVANDAAAASAGVAARWTPDVPTGGIYEVSFYAPHESSLNVGDGASAARFVVAAADGVHELPGVNHAPFAHDWQSLGAFPFAAGTNGWVELRADGSGGKLIADAVRFRRLTSSPGGGPPPSGPAAPAIASLRATAVEGVPFAVPFVASDPDTRREDLTIGLAATQPDDFPPGAAWNESAGLLEWASPGPPGSYSFVASVSDGVGPPRTATFRIKVVPADGDPDRDRRPVFAKVKDARATAFAGRPEVFTLPLVVVDPDGDPLGFQVDPNTPLPAGASFDAGSGVFSWAPDPSQAGRHTLGFVATAAGKAVRTKIRLTVVAGATP